MSRSVQAHTSSILPSIALPLPSTETLLTSSLLTICTGLQLKGEARSANGLQKTQHRSHYVDPPGLPALVGKEKARGYFAWSSSPHPFSQSLSGAARQEQFSCWPELFVGGKGKRSRNKVLSKEGMLVFL